MFRTNEKLDTDNFIRVSCFDYPRIGFHLTVSASTYSGFQTFGYLLVRVGCFQGVDCFSFKKRSRFDIENAEHGNRRVVWTLSTYAYTFGTLVRRRTLVDASDAHVMYDFRV